MCLAFPAGNSFVRFHTEIFIEVWWQKTNVVRFIVIRGYFEYCHFQFVRSTNADTVYYGSYLDFCVASRGAASPNMADTDPSCEKGSKASAARCSEPNKDKEKQPKPASRGKIPARQSAEKPGPSHSSTSETRLSKNREDEIMSILLAVRAEQSNTNKMLDSYDQRLKQLENFDHTQYDYDYDCGYDDGDYESMVDYEAHGESHGGSVSVGYKRKKDSNNNDNKDEESESSSRFASLAKKFKSQETCDKDVDSVLGDNVNNLFRKGMEEEQYDSMVKDEVNPRPLNCEGLVTVKLNQLVWDIVSPAARSRDKKLQTIETTIVKSASIITKTVDKAAKMEKECKEKGGECDIGHVIDKCNDALALLGHANKQINMFRRDLLKPEMRNEYSHLCTHSLPYTDQLFGDDVSKTAKEIEECSRMGHKLQYGPTRGSFRGRPGFRPRYRGGFHRGGFRGRGGMDYHHPQQMPKNPPRRGGLKRM